MKKISLLLLCLTLIQCQGQKEKEITKKEPMETYNETNQTQLPNLERRMYGIGVNIPGPYELYINDIAARKDYSSAMHNAAIEVNPYVLKSGKYSFRVRVFPMPSELEKGGIQPHTAKGITITFETFEKVEQGEGAKSGTFKVLQKYPVPVINKPVPFLDIEGEFEVALPYELEGWSKGQDLAKIDKKVLEEKVVKYYEKIRAIYNNGDIEESMRREEKRREETYIFNYTAKELRKQYEEKNNEILSERMKGNMLPIEDFTLHLYAQGRLVTLERNATQSFHGYDVNIKGWGPLIRKYNKAVVSTSIKLYLPEGSDEFVIIRK